MSARLHCVSSQVLDELRNGTKVNLDRYEKGDFSDLVAKGGWSVQLPGQIDEAALGSLVGTKGHEAEVANALAVWKALPTLTARVASEERLWVRLTHVECLEYSRARWFDVEKPVDSVEKHFFARTRTGRRDDNAIGRLWWGAYIASLCMPGDVEGALQIMLRRADTRQNLIKRANTAMRAPVTAAIIRMLKAAPHLGEEASFRELMKALNKAGAGVVFERLSPGEVDKIVQRCVLAAGLSIVAPGSA